MKTSDSIPSTATGTSPVTLWAELIDAAKRYEASTAARRQAEAEQQQAKDKLVAALGQATWGVLPDGRFFFICSPDLFAPVSRRADPIGPIGLSSLL